MHKFYPLLEIKSKIRILNFLFILFLTACTVSVLGQTQVGKYAFDGDVYEIAHAPDSSTYVGGTFQNIGLYCGNGVKLDTTEGTFSLSDVKVAGSINCIVSIPGGGWYIGGSFRAIEGKPRNYLARINADGSLHPFNPNLNNGVVSMACDEVGNLYVSGSFSTIDGVNRSRLAKFDSNGSLTDFSTSLSNAATKIILDSSNNILLCGYFTSVSGVSRNYFAKLNPDGSLNNLNLDFESVISSMSMDSDQNLYVGGYFTAVNGIPRNFFAKINADGTLNEFSPNFNEAIYAVECDKFGNLFVGGYFTFVNGQTRSHLVKFNSHGILQPINFQLDGSVSVLLADSLGNLFVGGSFTQIGGTSRGYLAKYNSNGTLSSFSPRLNSDVLCLALNENGELYAGGTLSAAGVVKRKYLAKFNVDGSLNTFDPRVNYLVRTIAFDQLGSTYIGGDFTNIGSSVRSRFAKFNANGTLDSLSITVNSPIQKLVIDNAGNIYFGGSFTTFNGNSRGRFAKLNADGTLNPFNPNFNNTVYKFLIDEIGNLYVVGSFTSVGSVTRKYFAKFNPDGILNQLDANISPLNNNSSSGSIRAILLDHAGNIYLGGYFSAVGGITRSNFAKLNSDGSLNAFTSSVNLSPNSFAIDSQGSLYVGSNGFFLNPNLACGITKFDAAGNLDTLSFSFKSKINSSVLVLAFDSLQRLHVGGSLRQNYQVYDFCTVPTITSSLSQSKCGIGNFTLEANSSIGEVNWYSSSFGAGFLDSGQVFTTPSLIASTTFFAEAVNGACKSESRTPVTATILSDCAKIKEAQCGTVIDKESTKIWSDPVQNATSYKFQITDSNGIVFILENVDRFFTFSQIPYMNNTTYSIRAAASVNGIYANFGDSCLIKLVLFSKIQNSQCGAAIQTADNKVNAIAISGATHYKFEITESQNQIILEDTSRWFKFSQFTYKPAIDYSIRVAVKINNVYSDFGPVCIVRSPVDYFEAYPNPSNGDFTLVSAIPGTFQIINELGQIIRIIEITEANNHQVKVENMPNGAYFVTGTSNGNVVTKKVIVVR
ncbi:MAG: T9SS type A sorting domain-containing protein [Crocinitomicaceae bacterium]|nr:T9SS type A sorting domain-containing protein [Crocinitomicaceae bacterium]